MIRRAVGVLLAVMLISTVFPVSLFAQGEDSLIINGEQVLTDIIMDNDRMLTPLNFISEKLGAEVKYDSEKTEVLIEDKYTLVELSIDCKTAIVHKKYDFTGKPLEVTLDAFPRLIGDTVYVPLRFIAENLNASVEWNNEKGIAEINTRKNIGNISYDLVSREEVSNSPVLLKWYENNKETKGIYFITEDNFTYIMVNAGLKNTGGYSVKIDGVVQNSPEQLFIYASVENPMAESAVTQVITYPCIFLKVNSTSIKEVSGTIF